jgi:hypothetical protein
MFESPEQPDTDLYRVGGNTHPAHDTTVQLGYVTTMCLHEKSPDLNGLKKKMRRKNR